MPTQAHGYAALSATTPLEPFQFERRDVGAEDVEIQVAFCGVCHSDVHQARDEWGGSTFPMVPGHEIAGHVTRVGAKVTKFKAGDTVGVGCLVDSCLSCRQCERGTEQYCYKGASSTYNSTEQDKKTVTQGGYSDLIVVREHFVLRVPTNLDLCGAAPLLCAGATTYAPLKYWGVTAGTRVGVVGIGGLGHMAVKLAHAMGAEVTVFTHTADKVALAKELGAHRVVNTTNADELKAVQGTLDVIVDAVCKAHDLSALVEALDVDGKLALVGMPPEAHPAVDPLKLISFRKCIGGSSIAGLPETQEMLDFCGEHNITASVQKIDIADVNEAYERMIGAEVHFRFVIDLATVKKA